MAAEEKKDLTSLMEYSKKLEESGQLPPSTAGGGTMEEVKIETIDHFESLDEYSKAHPMPEPKQFEEPVMESFKPAEAAPPPPPEPVPEFVPEPPPPPDGTQFPVSEFAPPEVPAADGPPVDFAGAQLTQAVTGQFADSPLGNDGLVAENPIAVPAPPEQLAGLEPTGMPGMNLNDPVPMESAPPPTEPSFVESSPPPVQEFAPEPVPEPASAPEMSVAPPMVEEPSAPAPEVPPPAPMASAPSPAYVPPPPPPTAEKKKPGAKKSTLDKVKQFAQSAPRARVAAAYPFSVLIDGVLKIEEREKLTDILEREQIGITPQDLEPQFEGGKVLIPRISEYLGVLIVQSLRGASVLIRLGPSDEVFSTAETRADDDELSELEDNLSTSSAEVEHPAERIPVTPESKLPEIPRFIVVDGLTASAAVHSDVVEAQASSAYQEVVEALRRELKYKAYRKGATAVVNFTVQMSTLTLPSHYRILVMGSAIRAVTDAAPSN